MQRPRLPAMPTPETPAAQAPNAAQPGAEQPPVRQADAAGSARRQQGLPPVWREDARILLLGSFPGTASLAASAYYAHPRNQFWPIVGALIGQPLADLPYPERLEQLRQHHIALWDTVAQCRRRGSLDANIRDAFLNEFQPLLERLPQLKLVAFNGKQAARQQAHFAAAGYATAILPSTSPAHASLGFQQKHAAWAQALTPWLDGCARPGRRDHRCKDTAI